MKENKKDKSGKDTGLGKCLFWYSKLLLGRIELKVLNTKISMLLITLKCHKTLVIKITLLTVGQISTIITVPCSSKLPIFISSLIYVINLTHVHK